MPVSAVARDVAQSRNVLLNLATELAFDRVIAVDDARHPRDLVFAQALGPRLRVDPGLFQDLRRGGAPDPV